VACIDNVARQTPRDLFSMWSDPSLLRNNGKAAFSTGSVHGLFSSDEQGVTRQLRGQFQLRVS
jgi:hypothetical protein